MRYKNEYRRSIEEYKSVSPVRRKIGLYWVLCILRIVLVTVQQTGYIHPDEYFQSIEVISGDSFDITVYKPWEFNATFPIRSAFISQLTIGIPYYILRNLSPISFSLFKVSLKSPYFLILFPRLLMCGLSFISDYCLYKICCMYGQNYKVRLITLASSYVMLTYATRTFSNAIELVLTSLLLYFTSECMAFSEKVVIQSDFLSQKYDKAKNGVERVKYYKLLGSLPSHSLNHCFKISTIIVIGIFNRPTFIAFAFPTTFFWLQRGLGSRSVGFGDFNIRIITLVLCSIPSIIFFILADSFYFGYLTMGEIGGLDIGMKNFVVTPLNFLKYNSNTQNLKTHGLHPRFLHFLVNVPLLFNILGIIGILKFGKMIYSILKGQWLDLPKIQSIVGLMTAAFIIPIALLSIVPHQEPRFILPVILPLVFLYAPQLGQISVVNTSVSRIDKSPAKSDKMEQYKITSLRSIWYISNFVLLIFYGFLHQGGVLPLTSHMATELKSKPHLMHIHVYTSYLYPLPTALLQLRNIDKVYVSSSNYKYRLRQDFFLYEQGSKDITEVYNNINLKLIECEEKYMFRKIPYRLYYAIPVSALEKLNSFNTWNHSFSLSYNIVKTFYPHISIESLPAIINIEAAMINLQTLNKLPTEYIRFAIDEASHFLKKLGLLLIRVKLSKCGANTATPKLFETSFYSENGH